VKEAAEGTGLRDGGQSKRYNDIYAGCVAVCSAGHDRQGTEGNKVKEKV
jgi:hypothetical protein